jgi:hypothetical protein
MELSLLLKNLQEVKELLNRKKFLQREIYYRLKLKDK